MKIYFNKIYQKHIFLGYVWFPESTKKKKKNAKENNFLMFGCPIKNIKESQI